jgi:hypothetical protein
VAWPNTDVAEISVIVYLRRPDLHFVSLYSEMLRWGGAKRPDLLTTKIPAGHGYDYNGMLQRWSSVFGTAAVKPRLFERPPGGRFDAVQDFLGVCGVTLEAELPETAAAANQSINLAGQAMLLKVAERIRSAGVGDIPSPSWDVTTKAASQALPGKGWVPTRQEAQAFVERYAESNEAVRRQWFPERAQLFSSDFNEYPEVAPVVSQDEMIDAAARMLVAMADMYTEQRHERRVKRQGTKRGEK